MSLGKQKTFDLKLSPNLAMSLLNCIEIEQVDQAHSLTRDNEEYSRLEQSLRRMITDWKKKPPTFFEDQIMTVSETQIKFLDVIRRNQESYMGELSEFLREDEIPYGELKPVWKQVRDVVALPPEGT